MSSKQTKTIHVYADWVGLGEKNKRVGELSAIPSRGREIFSFSYKESWLENSFAMSIDPDLGNYTGPQYLHDDKKSNFGIFLDSSPDRWGRLLMRRREALDAREQKRPERTLLESDYLLGVHDESRMGGLRFKTSTDGMFLDGNKNRATPPWASLRELEHASLQLEKDTAPDDPDYRRWLDMLISPGSSLGGARPKASVKDPKNQLWLAKFPSGNDNVDIGAWEMLVNILAKKCSLHVTEAKLKRFNCNHRTFLSKRFDRTSSGKRVHFASAMTMLGYIDGNDHLDGVSYLEIAEFLIKHGENSKRDLEEVWKRIVFSICVSNTDDHLRNHGFVLGRKGWSLSPAYDLNPVPTGTGLKLNISENDNSLDLELAKSVKEYFRVSEAKSAKIIDDVVKNVRQWKSIATQLNIPRQEQELMAASFRAIEPGS